MHCCHRFVLPAWSCTQQSLECLAQLRSLEALIVRRHQQDPESLKRSYELVQSEMSTLPRLRKVLMHVLRRDLLRPCCCWPPKRLVTVIVLRIRGHCALSWSGPGWRPRRRRHHLSLWVPCLLLLWYWSRLKLLLELRNAGRVDDRREQ